MPSAGFEPVTPVIERPETYALDGKGTGKLDMVWSLKYRGKPASHTNAEAKDVVLSTFTILSSVRFLCDYSVVLVLVIST